MGSIRKKFSFGMTDDELICLFPYGKVNSGSDILIYGAGRVGQYFFQQIKETGYCNVLALVDREWKKYNSKELGVKIISPKQICRYDFDYIVIAISDDKFRQEIFGYIINEIMLDKNKVISEPCLVELNFLPKDNVCNQKEEESFAYDFSGDTLSIAFFVKGGLGDIIIAKKIITYILSLINGDFKVDVYGTQMFTRAILSDCPNINNYLPGSIYYRYRKNYDLAINAFYVMSVDVAAYDRMMPNNSKLASVIKHLENQLDAYNLPASNNFEINSIHFGRCKYLNRDAYTAYTEKGGIEIHDTDVSIPLNKSFEEEYMNLGLKRYITIHYGWGLYAQGCKLHAKMWPAEYFSSLVKMIKAKYKGVEVIQLGEQTDVHIDGVDKYILSKNFELVKYILRETILHIGIDGGLVHLATQLGTKCVVLFGPTPAWYFGYKSNINIVAKNCNSCCGLDGDLTRCLRGMDKPECMYSITPEIVMGRIQSYLDNSID